MVEPGFFEEVVALARKYRFFVIHDFAYGDIGFEGYEPPSFLSVKGAKEVGCEFTTMSKGYNMAGWRVGFAAGNRDMLAALKAIKGYYDYGLFQAVQVAAIVAMRHGEEGRLAQVAEYQARRDALVRGLKRIGWDAEAPRAGMFLWTAMPEPWKSRMNSIDFAMKLLEEAHVAVSPGRGFGETGEGYLRLALVENCAAPPAGRPPDRSLPPAGGHGLVNAGGSHRSAHHRLEDCERIGFRIPKCGFRRSETSIPSFVRSVRNPHSGIGSFTNSHVLPGIPGRPRWSNSHTARNH